MRGGILFMKFELDFEDLESQWKKRQLDLFPWLDGLFALLQSRDAIIKETEKRLSKAANATMIQFLSSDDHDNARVARQTIKKQEPETILPILIYSLEKVEKKDYPHRIMESLLDFDPNLSFGYLLVYLNQRPGYKENVFQVISEIFSNYKDFYSTPQDENQFLEKIFNALCEDLIKRMPVSNKLKTMEDFESIRLDLKVMLLIFQKMQQADNVRVVERQMKNIGQEVIVSLSSLPFEFEKRDIILKQLGEFIIYMALMRLESDRSFLKKIPLKIGSLNFLPEDAEAINQKVETALNIIDQPDKAIQEILDETEMPLFF